MAAEAAGPRLLSHQSHVCCPVTVQLCKGSYSYCNPVSSSLTNVPILIPLAFGRQLAGVTYQNLKKKKKDTKRCLLAVISAFCTEPGFPRSLSSSCFHVCSWKREQHQDLDIASVLFPSQHAFHGFVQLSRIDTFPTRCLIFPSKYRRNYQHIAVELFSIFLCPLQRRDNIMKFV